MASEPNRTDTELTAVLEELRALLEETHDLDASTRDALHDAAAEIQVALNAEEDTVSQLSAAIRERIERFEDEHPSITEVIRRLVNQLSEMGI